MQPGGKPKAPSARLGAEAKKQSGAVLTGTCRIGRHLAHSTLWVREGPVGIATGWSHTRLSAGRACTLRRVGPALRGRARAPGPSNRRRVRHGRPTSDRRLSGSQGACAPGGWIWEGAVKIEPRWSHTRLRSESRRVRPLAHTERAVMTAALRGSCGEVVSAGAAHLVGDMGSSSSCGEAPRAGSPGRLPCLTEDTPATASARP